MKTLTANCRYTAWQSGYMNGWSNDTEFTMNKQNSRFSLLKLRIQEKPRSSRFPRPQFVDAETIILENV